MTYSGIITFGASAIQITDPVNGVTTFPPGSSQMARRIVIEPLRGNTHAAYVGLANVTNTGTGAAIQELAVPPASTVPLDRFLDVASGSDHNIDPTVYYVHGTTGEKVKVTLDLI